MSIIDYDVTAANNTVIGATGILGNNQVLNFDNALRQLMADLALMYAGTDPMPDTIVLMNAADTTKRFNFDVSGVTSNQTRTMTVPDVDLDFTAAGAALISGEGIVDNATAVRITIEDDSFVFRTATTANALTMNAAGDLTSLGDISAVGGAFSGPVSGDTGTFAGDGAFLGNLGLGENLTLDAAKLIEFFTNAAANDTATASITRGAGVNGDLIIDNQGTGNIVINTDGQLLHGSIDITRIKGIWRFAEAVTYTRTSTTAGNMSSSFDFTPSDSLTSRLVIWSYIRGTIRHTDGGNNARGTLRTSYYNQNTVDYPQIGAMVVGVVGHQGDGAGDSNVTYYNDCLVDTISTNTAKKHNGDTEVRLRIRGEVDYANNSLAVNEWQIFVMEIEDLT